MSVFAFPPPPRAVRQRFRPRFGAGAGCRHIDKAVRAFEHFVLGHAGAHRDLLVRSPSCPCRGAIEYQGGADGRNLLENSIKFGRDALQRRIRIHVRRCEANVQVVVEDSGPGIPRRDLERVFEDFYRVDNALTRNTSGTGIGLALVRKLVQAMGGRVGATNNQGPGCTITITQPL